MPTQRKRRTNLTRGSYSLNSFACAACSSAAFSSAWMLFTCFALHARRQHLVRLKNAPGARQIDLQLLLQFFHAGERPSIPQPIYEIDAQSLTVEIAHKTDQVRFNLARVFAEGGVGADVHRREPGLSSMNCPGRIYPVPP